MSLPLHLAEQQSLLVVHVKPGGLHVAVGPGVVGWGVGASVVGAGFVGVESALQTLQSSSPAVGSRISGAGPPVTSIQPIEPSCREK